VKFDPIQTDFGTGEISPKAQGHVDAAIYKAGLARMMNFIPGPEGSSASRQGAEFINSGNASEMLIPLDGGPEEGLVLGLSVSQARLLNKNRTQVWQESYDALLDLKDWTTNFFGTFPDHAVWFDVPEGKIYLRGNANAVSAFGPTQAIGAGPGTRVMSIIFYCSGDPVRCIVSDFGSANIWANVVCNPGRNVINFTPPADASTVGFTFQLDAGGGQKVANVWGMTVDRNGFKQQDFGLVLPKFTGALRHVTFWTNNTFYCVCFIKGQNPFGVYYTVPTPGNRTNPVWNVLNHATAFPVPPDPKALPTGRKTRITAVAVYQERLWLGFDDGLIRSTKVNYGAGVPVVFDFTAPSAPPLAAESLDLKMSATSRVITWFATLRGLLMGAANQEWLFTQRAVLALDPTTGAAFDINEQSFYGTDAELNAVPVLDKVLLPMRGRKRFRLGNFSDQTQGGFAADEFSTLGEHLLAPRVRQVAFLRSPIPRLVFLMEDNTMASATLDQKGNAAWSRFQFPTTWVPIAICAVETSIGAELWISAAGPGANEHAILRVRDFDSTPRTKRPVLQFLTGPNNLYQDLTMDPPVMDIFIRRPVTAAGVRNIILPLLSAAPVQVLSRGLYMGAPNHTGGVDYNLPLPDPTFQTATYVDEGGLRQPNEAVVGFSYPEHKFRTLALEGGNPAGTGQGKLSRFVKLWLRVVNSYLPIANGQRAPELADGQTLDTNKPVTGDISHQDLNFTRGAIVEVSQDLPLRVEVTAIFGSAQSNSL
jgi:hypothetical protein